jgi:hypothetical protein
MAKATYGCSSGPTIPEPGNFRFPQGIRSQLLKLSRDSKDPKFAREIPWVILQSPGKLPTRL